MRDPSFDRIIAVYDLQSDPEKGPPRLTHVPVLKADLRAILDELREARRLLGVPAWPEVPQPRARLG